MGHCRGISKKSIKRGVYSMKIKNWAFAAVAAIIALSFAFTGCNDDSGGTSTVVWVPDVAVTGVTLDKATMGLHIEDETGIALSATVAPATATNKNLIWSISPAGVVSFDNGVVIPKALGNATITVKTDDGGFKATCTVTVGHIPAESVTIDPPTLDLFIGETGLLEATVGPEGAADLSVRWETSDFTKAIVASDGTVYAISSGTVNIIARTHNNIAKTCVVTVSHSAVTNVELNFETLDLGLFKTKQLVHTLVPENATFKGVSWASNDTSVATVTSTGIVTGVSLGEATITVTTKDGGLTADCVVTVFLPPLPPLPEAWIPNGTFTMGAFDTEQGYWTAYEGPRHQVTISKGFYMSIDAVSQALYKEIMGVNPSYYNIEGSELEEFIEEWPVDTVNWYTAVEFCNKLSLMKDYEEVYTITGRTPATGYPITAATVTADWTKNGYRLPTEAEWEYACRAGTDTAFNFAEVNWVLEETHVWFDWEEEYCDIYLPTTKTGAWGSDWPWLDWANFDAYVPYNGRGAYEYEAYWGQTVPWMLFTPEAADAGWGSDGLDHANKWGLYNMHGNLTEWCWDYMLAYTSESVTDPHHDTQGPAGNYKAVRGGSWEDAPAYVRSGTRAGASPQTAYFSSWLTDSHVIGFRVVRNGVAPSPSEVIELSNTAKQKAKIVPPSVLKSVRNMDKNSAPQGHESFRGQLLRNPLVK
jgi:uncharacterized protein YjdB/formylglycine-generating enzyme required for sulfatase activity